MSMRLLVDANVSIRLVARLRALGHDVVSVLEESPNASDEVILRRAVSENRTVMTYDKDFGELVFQSGEPHRGIVLIRARDESYDTYLKILKNFLATHSESEIHEHFWILSDADIRRAQ